MNLYDRLILTTGAAAALGVAVLLWRDQLETNDVCFLCPNPPAAPVCSLEFDETTTQPIRPDGPIYHTHCVDGKALVLTVTSKRGIAVIQLK